MAARGPRRAGCLDSYLDQVHSIKRTASCMRRHRRSVEDTINTCWSMHDATIAALEVSKLHCDQPLNVRRRAESGHPRVSSRSTALRAPSRGDRCQRFALSSRSKTLDQNGVLNARRTRDIINSIAIHRTETALRHSRRDSVPTPAVRRAPDFSSKLERRGRQATHSDTTASGRR